MEFILLLLTNIFIGAVLYLVISLKLEKKSTEFREQKFRKEMDEVIRQFNAAAERNISLLENKIDIMKRMLERSGQLKTVNITLGTEGMSDHATEHKRSIKSPVHSGLEKANIISGPSAETPVQQGIGRAERPEKIARPGMDAMRGITAHLAEGFKTLFAAGRNEITGRLTRFLEKSRDVSSGKAVKTPPRHTVETGNIIAKDLSGHSEARPAAKKGLSDGEIIGILSSSGDKYAVITRLSDNGCSAEVISDHSGIPVGEVKLVLNLHNSR